MTDDSVIWQLATRHVEPNGEAVSAIDLAVSYPGRKCDISISLSPPIAGQTPEHKAALDEFRRLRDALNSILGER